MAEKHYGIANANRLIEVNGVALRFTPYEHSAGAYTGFYSTSNTQEQKSLDALVKAKEIFVMTGEELENIKKKAPSLRSSTVSPAQPPPVEDAVAVAENKELPDVEDILAVEKVAKPVVKKRGRNKST